MIVGIDLGTTNSLVGAMRDGRPVLFPNAVGNRMTPSAVHVDLDGTVLIGDAARARAITTPSRTATAFKRDMGTDSRYTLGERVFSPIELSALVLGSLKADAEAALGSPVQRAVITVPAWFGEPQRRATRDAAQVAGLQVEMLLNEPTAAAIAYGLDERGADLTAVIVDLGGGTFDVTVLEIVEGLVEIRATAGEARLGGEDFTAAIAEALIEDICREHATDAVPPRSRSRLVGAAETIKRALSASSQTSLVLPELDIGARRVDVSVTFDRARAERLWAPILVRLRAPIAKALRDARITRPDVVLPVGGAARLPCFLSLVEQVIGVAPLRRLDPDCAVAEGAVIRAARVHGDASVEDLVITDVATHSLGIRTVVSDGRNWIDDVFSPILERGTVLPASREGKYRLIGTGRGQAKLDVYEGDNPRCRDNTLLRSIEVPSLGASDGEELLVRFSYDASGLLEVDARFPRIGQSTSQIVERAPGALGPAAIEQIRRSLAALKIHPRDLLPNATAIARAEALWPELRGSEREHLGHALAAFYLAVEGQDAAIISVARIRLLAIVDAHAT